MRILFAKCLKDKFVAQWLVAGLIVIPFVIVLYFSVPFQAMVGRDLQINGKTIEATIIEIEYSQSKSGSTRMGNFEYKIGNKIFTHWLAIGSNTKIGDKGILKYAPNFPWYATFKETQKEPWDENLVGRIILSLSLGTIFLGVWLHGIITAYKKYSANKSM